MTVYFKKVGILEKDVATLLKSLSWKELIHGDDTVLIKPNFCTHELKKGDTTNLDLLEALVRITSKRAAEVLIGETYSGGKNFAKLRENLAREWDLVNLSTTDTYQYTGSSGTYRLPKLALESKIINVPVLKTHTLTGATLGIKNLFGLIQDKNKSKYHLKINKVLADLLQVLSPQITILDALHHNFLLASRDVIALDSAACQLMGADPLSIEHIRLATAGKERPVIITGSGYDALGLDLEIPEFDRAGKIAVFLQGNQLTRRLLELPGVYTLARRLRRML